MRSSSSKRESAETADVWPDAGLERGHAGEPGVAKPESGNRRP